MYGERICRLCSLPDIDLNIMKQVGGDHYASQKIQPIDYIQANDLGFEEGNIIKYITRHKLKNGREDVEKAKHYCELLLRRYECKEEEKDQS